MYIHIYINVCILQCVTYSYTHTHYRKKTSSFFKMFSNVNFGILSSNMAQIFLFQNLYTCYLHEGLNGNSVLHADLTKI